jgi:putative transposase
MSLINKRDNCYSLRDQSLLLGINWSTLYYRPIGINPIDREMMDLLDKQYTNTPFYGVLRMRQFLKSKGYKVGKEHVRTLLRNMGLCAVFPGPKTSNMRADHKIYPYLLRGLEIEYPNQIWSTDITYLRLVHGFAYLVAIIDWYSRCVLSYRISNTLDAGFCVEALEEALSKYKTPDIFNSDQGSQFTSLEFTEKLLAAGILISMDGRGRVFDNIFVERLWRSVKYENIYLNDYQDIPEARYGLKNYFEFYNNERFHQALKYKTPWQVYSDVLPQTSIKKGGELLVVC